MESVLLCVMSLCGLVWEKLHYCALGVFIFDGYATQGCGYQNWCYLIYLINLPQQPAYCCVSLGLKMHIFALVWIRRSLIRIRLVKPGVTIKPFIYEIGRVWDRNIIHSFTTEKQQKNKAKNETKQKVVLSYEYLMYINIHFRIYTTVAYIGNLMLYWTYGYIMKIEARKQWLTVSGN